MSKPLRVSLARLKAPNRPEASPNSPSTSSPISPLASGSRDRDREQSHTTMPPAKSSSSNLQPAKNQRNERPSISRHTIDTLTQLSQTATQQDDENSPWPPRQSLDEETEQDRQERLERERQAKKVSDDIDDEIEHEKIEKKKKRPDVRILLLGELLFFFIFSPPFVRVTALSRFILRCFGTRAIVFTWRRVMRSSSHWVCGYAVQSLFGSVELESAAVLTRSAGISWSQSILQIDAVYPLQYSSRHNSGLFRSRHKHVFSSECSVGGVTNYCSPTSLIHCSKRITHLYVLHVHITSMLFVSAR